MAKKKFDPKAKAKRQKVILAVGGVLLLGVLAFQVPRTMKLMKSQSQSAPSAPSTATTTTAGSTPLAPPALRGSSTAGTSASIGGSSASTSADGVSDPSNPLPPNAGQLVSFSKFKSKDPFDQQIASACVPESDGDTLPPGCAAASSTSSTSENSASTPATQPKVIIGAPKPVAAKPRTATISVNGASTTVSIGGSFPGGSPVFTLVSLTTSAARIGIAGGTYQNGAPTVTLKMGKTVTLMNTADGTRYVLRLLAIA